MPSIENRITQLETQTNRSDCDSLRVVYCETGESIEQARLRSGVPADFAGKVLSVQFVASPNSLKEVAHE